MDNQETSDIPSRPTIFSAKSKQQVAGRTVADLLGDKAAMDDWKNNIEKIRQKESDSATMQTAQKG